MCFLFLQLMCYVCFTKHSQFSGNTVIGMPHLCISCAALYHLPQVLLWHYFFCVLTVNLFVHVYMLWTVVFLLPLPLWFNSPPGVQRMSVGAKQSFTELYASSQRAVCFPILLKVSDVRPNVGWGRASRYLYTSCCRGVQARSRKRHVIHTNPSYPSTHPWIFLHCAPSV